MEGVRSSNLLSSTRYDGKIASQRPFPEDAGRAFLLDPYGIGTAIMVPGARGASWRRVVRRDLEHA
jgi:hypothetical protein